MIVIVLWRPFFVCFITDVAEQVYIVTGGSIVAEVKCLTPFRRYIAIFFSHETAHAE